LVAIEREPESLEESDLISSMTVDDSRIHVNNLQSISWRFVDTNPELLKSLIWNVLTGSQLIVKSEDSSARRYFLFAYAHILPIGCVRIASNVNHYMDQYRCNFMGCAPNVEIPEAEFKSAFVVSLRPVKISHGCSDWRMFDFVVENSPRRDTPEPKLVRRYFQLLSDTEINDLVLDAAVKASRTEWLNHAKFLFQLSRQREQICLDDVVKILRCGLEDSPVLLFFQTGLSKKYKQVVLNTIMSGSSRSSSQASSPQKS